MLTHGFVYEQVRVHRDRLIASQQVSKQLPGLIALGLHAAGGAGAGRAPREPPRALAAGRRE